MIIVCLRGWLPINRRLAEWQSLLRPGFFETIYEPTIEGRLELRARGQPEHGKKTSEIGTKSVYEMTEIWTSFIKNIHLYKQLSIINPAGKEQNTLSFIKWGIFICLHETL